MSSPRIAVVLGSGGLRGRASLGVLSRLRSEGVPIDAVVGVSAGALIGAYHASVGWDIPACIEQVALVDSRALLALSAARSRFGPLARAGRARAVFLERSMARLEEASFERLHHGISALGVVAFDLESKRPVLFATGLDNDGVPLSAAVRGSAAVPGLFGPVVVDGRTRRYRLVDGGVAEPLPVHRAFAPPINADRVIAVDISRDPRSALAARRACAEWGGAVAIVRPRVRGAGTILSRRGLTGWLVERGARAVTEPVLARIESWLLG